jgi:hypothetical protein
MNLVWSRRCVMFTVLLAACVAGALAPGRAEAALSQRGGMVGSSASITIQATGERLPMAGVQRCSGAIDATGTSGAGIGRLIDLGHGMYDFVLQLNQDFLSQFAPDLMSFGYQVTYSVNGQMAKGLFAGDLKFRAGNEHIHSRQRIQGRVYSYEGKRRKKDVIRTGDILQLKIVDYMVDLVQARTFPVHGTITCQV